jgi:D-alanyl-D-alanine carboxypeptidase
MFEPEHEPQRTWHVRVESAVYGIRLFALVFALITAVVVLPGITDTTFADMLGTAAYTKRITNLNQQLASVYTARNASDNERIYTRLQQYVDVHKGTANELATAPVYIAIDTERLRLHIYEHGVPTHSYAIQSVGVVGTHWQTPTGVYAVSGTQESQYIESAGVHLPYAVQFAGNFFIHGVPHTPDGMVVDSTFAEHSIELSTDDAHAVFERVQPDTPVFVYAKPAYQEIPVTVTNTHGPAGITARSYLLADIHTGRVYFEKNSKTKRPIASMSKLMTAAVANETLFFDKTLTIDPADGTSKNDFGLLVPGTELSVSEVLYPLLMESNNAAASALARRLGEKNFVQTMNNTAQAIGARTLTFRDSSGISAYNAGTAEDVFKLARYAYESQPFILAISKTHDHTNSAGSYTNHNHFADDPDFVGGKTGFTNAAGQTMVALFDADIDGVHTTVAAVVLGSNDREGDIRKLLDQFKKVAVVDDARMAATNPFTASAFAGTQNTLDTLRVIGR